MNPLSYAIDSSESDVDSIIDLQKDDGWIFPCTTKENFEKYDLWTVIILLRAFKVYYECSRDEKIPGVMYKVLKNLYDLLTEEKTHLFQWAHQRWQELFGAIGLVYNIYGEEWIRDLAKIMKAQGKDYNIVTEKWKRPLNVWHHDTHIVNLTIDLETDYPFNHQLKYTVKAKKDFTFKIRIPSFSEETTVNGEIFDGNLLSYDLKAGEERVISISLKVSPCFEKTPVGLSTVKYGALIFALPANVEDWEYGYVNKELKVNYNASGKIPFSLENPPVTVKAIVKSIDWGFEDGYDTVCAKLPCSLIPVSGEKEVTLVPYGAAKLRMTEMPVVE